MRFAHQKGIYCCSNSDPKTFSMSNLWNGLQVYLWLRGNWETCPGCASFPPNQVFCLPSVDASVTPLAAPKTRNYLFPCLSPASIPSRARGERGRQMSKAGAVSPGCDSHPQPLSPTDGRL